MLKAQSFNFFGVVLKNVKNLAITFFIFETTLRVAGILFSKEFKSFCFKECERSLGTIFCFVFEKDLANAFVGLKKLKNIVFF